MSDISIPSLFEDLASAGNSFGVTGKYDANDLTVDVIENAITGIFSLLFHLFLYALYSN